MKIGLSIMIIRARQQSAARKKKENINSRSPWPEFLWSSFNKATLNCPRATRRFQKQNTTFDLRQRVCFSIVRYSFLFCKALLNFTVQICSARQNYSGTHSIWLIYFCRPGNGHKKAFYICHLCAASPVSSFIRESYQILIITKKIKMLNLGRPKAVTSGYCAVEESPFRQFHICLSY